MSEMMHISLPSPLKKWVDRQAAKKGHSTSDEFILDMLRREQATEARERIDAILIESLDSGPSTPMTAKDWQNIRAAGRRRFNARRKK